ncbi:beta-2-microglobulin isoform X2 [Centroberyx gerrardi]
MYFRFPAEGSFVVSLALLRTFNIFTSISKSIEGEIMNTFILSVLFCILGTLMAKESPPQVQVYSRNPGDFKKENTLICHVTNFHPPDITINLLKNGMEIPNAYQTDLAFGENWHYHLTKSVAFIPQSGEKFTCKVTHMGNPMFYSWEPDM